MEWSENIIHIELLYLLITYIILYYLMNVFSYYIVITLNQI
jgi:hypothetical protein